MSEGERRGRRRRRKRRRTPFSGRLRTVRARVAAGLALALVATAVVLVLHRAQGPGPGVPTGRAYHVARLALGAGDLVTALREARAAVEAEPRSRDARLLLALVLHRRGEGAEASRLLAEDVRKDLDDDDGRVLLAAFAMRDEDYATALVLLREAVEREPTPSGAWRLLAEIRALTGDRDGAVTACRRATAMSPDDLRAWLALGDLQLAVALDTASVVAREEAGRAYDAAARIARARLRTAATTELRLALAKALAGRARALRDSSLADAERELRALADAAGDEIEPVLALASFLGGTGRDSDARVVLEAAERRRPGPEVRRSLARVLESLGEPAEAAAALRRAVTADAGDTLSRVALVDALARAGRLDEAADALAGAPEDGEAAWRIDEAAGDLARVRARAAEAAGDASTGREMRAASRAAYERALALRPRSMPLQKKRFGALLEAGWARPDELTEDERAAAHRYVMDVLALNPADADALAWRARLLLLEGAPESAFALLAPAVAGDAPPVGLLRLYGNASERTARDDLAADAYSRALERLTHGDDARRDDRAAPPDLWADAARGALRMGRRELAESTAEAGVTAWPDSLALRLTLAAARLLDGRDAAALASLAEAGERLPEASEIPLLAALVHERAGRLDRAESTLRAALAARDDAVLRFALARHLGRRGRLDEMRAELTAAVAASRDPVRAALREGDVLLALDPPAVDAACDAFRRAESAVEGSREALVRLADVALLVAGDDPGALTAARAAVARCAEAGVAATDRDYLEGKLALLEGDAPGAVRRLERCVAGGARSVAALYHLAVARRAVGDAAGAAAALRRAVDGSPADARLRAELAALRVDIAAAALADGRSAEALLLLQDAGDAPGSTLLLAAARVARSELDLAEPVIRAHVAAGPGEPLARHLLAAVLLHQGGAPRLEEASTLYRELLAERPDDVHALVGLAAARAALGDTAGAVDAWDRAAASHPDDPAVLRGRVSALVAAGRADEALAAVERVVAAGEGAASTSALHGDLLLHVGRLDAAAVAYLRAADADPADVRPLLGAAAALAAAGRTDEARGLLEQRLGRCADQRPGRRALGDLLARGGELAAARGALERAAGAGVPTGWECLLLGSLAEREGDTARATRVYESHRADDSVRVATQRRLAALLTAAGEPRRAVDAFDVVLRLAPDDAAAINDRALLLALDEDRLAEAVSEARRARALAPGRPEIADTLGWLLVRMGRATEAEALLEEAADALPGRAEVLFHAGVCLARVGREDEARARLERALELDPAFPGADAARSQLDRLR